MNGNTNTGNGRLPSSQMPPVTGEETAGFLSRLTFHWIAPLMTAGYLRPLKEADLWTISPSRRVVVTSDHLHEAFQRRLAERQSNSLVWALYEVFRKDFWIAGIGLFLSQIFQILAPLAVRFLIQYVSNDRRDPSSSNDELRLSFGIWLSLALFLVQVVMTFGFWHGIYHGQVVGAGIRASLSSLIFKKSLRLPESRELKDGSNQSDLNPVNLLSTDTVALERLMMVFHMIWTGPTAVVAGLVLLFINLTYSALGGVLLIVLGAATVNKVSTIFIARRKEISTARDQRAALLEEILNSMRSIKINASEEKLLSKIKQYRNEEIRSMERSIAVSNIFIATAATLPAFSAMFSFIIFSLTGHALTAAEVFSSLAVYNGIRMPLQQLPVLVQMVAGGKVSVDRIESYLSLPEPTVDVKIDPKLPNAMEVKHAMFSWKFSNAVKNSIAESRARDETSPLLPSNGPLSEYLGGAFTIRDVNLSATRGDLVAIVGDVASGKSSLLAGLATEMPQLAGTLTFRSNRAYCSQTAWIMTGSVRDNILFGRPYRSDFYNEVVMACALKPDFDSLIDGDLTQVGERGITLSGGQKQRISLARAIYSDCEIVLLDDPLSAVDANVGRHILDNVILNLLKDKCTVIATHNFDILPHCTNIVWLESGRIEAQGTLEKLQHNSEIFGRLTKAVRSIQKTKTAGGEKQTEASAANLKTASSSIAAKVSQIENEKVDEGSVTWKTLATYLNATGWGLPWILVVVLLILTTGSAIFTNIWLAWWSSDTLDLSRDAYIGGYVGLTVLQFVIYYTSEVISASIGLLTSEALFERTIERVIAASISYFDITPIGRLLSLFTTDIDALDNNVTRSLKYFLNIFVLVFVTLAMVAVYLPPFAVVFPPLLLFAYFGTKFYRASARNLARHVAQFRGNATAKAHEAISGRSTIRAYGAQTKFCHSVEDAIDRETGASYLEKANGPFISIRGDLAGNLLVLLTGVLVVVYRGSISPATSGLVLTYVITLTQPVTALVQTSTLLETSLVSVERIIHYASVEPEDKHAKVDQLRSTWPDRGSVCFRHVSLHYRPELPAVLRDISLDIDPGTRVAIVGRTGSGKSTLLSALVRLTPIDSDGGKIIVDNVDITDIRLRKLRSSIKMVPQEPAIFAGTIRSNLDPEGIYDDETLVNVLQDVGLLGTNAEHVNVDSSQSQGNKFAHQLSLDTTVSARGTTLSQGQRQLLALSSIFLPPSPISKQLSPCSPKILVLDEPTSALSSTADERVHDQIRKKWEGRTVVMIAHRLKTLLASKVDMVVVMDTGKIVEVGDPHDLWVRRSTSTSSNGSGKFKELCDAAGITEEDF